MRQFCQESSYNYMIYLTDFVYGTKVPLNQVSLVTGHLWAAVCTIQVQLQSRKGERLNSPKLFVKVFVIAYYYTLILSENNGTKQLA